MLGEGELREKENGGLRVKNVKQQMETEYGFDGRRGGREIRRENGVQREREDDEKCRERPDVAACSSDRDTREQSGSRRRSSRCSAADWSRLNPSNCGIAQRPMPR